LRSRRVTSLFAVLLLVSAITIVFTVYQLPIPVQAAATLSIAPVDGPPGTKVSVTGSGFANPGSNGACSLTAAVAGVISSASCSISAGVLTGYFTVGPGAPTGATTVTATPNNNVADTGTAPFTVDQQPTLTLTPGIATQGSPVSITLAIGQFSSGDTSCTITSPTSGFSFQSTACVISGGDIAGSQFTVGNGVAPGTYLIVVTAKGPTIGGVVIGGDSATQSLTVATAFTPTIITNFGDGPPGTKITLQGTGFSTQDSSCQVTASNPLLLTQVSSCTISSGKFSSVTFVVGSGATPGVVTITVTGNTGDSASVSFTVDTAPALQFSPASPQPPGTTVQVSLTGLGKFSSGDAPPFSTSCTISSSPSGLFSSSACVISSGGSSLTGTFFIVGNVQVGKSYTVTVKGALGDTASAVFTVSSPFVATVSLSPSDGPTNTKVTVQGTGFPGQDATCALSSLPSGLFAASPAPTCSISSGIVTASFTVSSGASPAIYTVTVTSSSAVSASAQFTVDASPTLGFSPASPQPPGTTILVSLASGKFSSGDTSCTIGSTPGGLFASSACFILGGGSSIAGTFFVVANVASGSSYQVVVTGNLGDKATGVFTVISPVGPYITTTPSDGPRGTSVTVQGSGFPGQDSSCFLTTTPTNIATSTTCSISGGKITGSFTVATGATPGPYTVTVTSSSGAVGTAPFTVDASPVLVFTPPSPGTPGTTVQVSLAPLTQFSSGDTSCTITSSPGGLFQSSACSITGGGTILTGTFFVVAAVPQGSSYTITITGNRGDTATGTYTVTIVLSLTLNPTSGTPGDTILFVGRGLLLTDTSCQVTSSTGTNGATLVSSPTCSFSSGTATGTFVVGPKTTIDNSPYTVTVTGYPGADSVNAQFNVVPNITLTPSSGVGGTTVTVTGAGFSAAATSCTLTAFPAILFAVSPAASCQFIQPGPNGNGQISGGFVVVSPTVAGTYVVTVTETGGTGASASATFVVGTSNAQLTITPNIGVGLTFGTPMSVGITGFGFNGGDTACTITPIPLLFSVSSCSISGGNVGGSFTVLPTAPPGYYLITVTGTPAGDFASNYFEVAVTTLTTSTTSSTSFITSTTSFTTTTTSINTFSTLTTTTFTFTGVSTWTSWFYTTTTSTGQSATTQTFTSEYTIVQPISTSTVTQTSFSTATHTYGLAVAPSYSPAGTVNENLLALISVMLLFVPVFLRRLLG
jgi:hypothetical protein